MVRPVSRTLRILIFNHSIPISVQIHHNNLTERIASKQEELKRCVFITEHCLYLLWAHLDFFMLRAIPVNTLHFNLSYGSDSMSRNAP